MCNKQGLRCKQKHSPNEDLCVCVNKQGLRGKKKHIVLHFLLQCSKYDAEGERLYITVSEIDHDFMQLSDLDKFRFLLHHVIRQTAKFIKRAYNNRYNTINST